jgi:23S rRNA (guanosine2251-2'-O)-methyltransferase
VEGDLAFGFHAVQSLLDHEAKAIERIWIDSARNDSRSVAIQEQARQSGVRVQRVPKEKLADMAGKDARHQGVIAQIRQVPTRHESDLEPFLAGIDGLPLLLVLDGIQVPHNLGACLRTAAAVGAHAVVLPKDKSAPLNATVRKVASGALESLQIFQVTNLARAIERIKAAGVWVIGTAGDAESDLYQSNFNLPLAIVVGSEGKGLRKLTRDLCDSLVRIPIADTMESLNVSVATGVCLYEVVRQRLSE